MDTRPITAHVLGPEAERITKREHQQLRDLLPELDAEQWATTTRHGATVGGLVQHLAEGAERLAAAIEMRDEHEGRPLFDNAEPHATPELEHDADERAAVVDRYERSSQRLERVLGITRIRDWSWPSWSPLGGVENLAEMARRWITHHFVHRNDILEATGRPVDDHDDTLRLVVEHVLDMIARRGGDVVEAPATFELMTNNPGAGTWTLRFDDPDELRRADLEIWLEIIGSRPQLPNHRVERGAPTAPRASARATAEQVWRAAFSRGVDWRELEVHGDDVGITMWEQLVGAVRADHS